MNWRERFSKITNVNQLIVGELYLYTIKDSKDTYYCKITKLSGGEFIGDFWNTSYGKDKSKVRHIIKGVTYGNSIFGAVEMVKEDELEK